MVAVLKALDVDASSDEAIVRSMTQLEVENSKRLLPSTIVATTGKPTGITLNCSSDADITASIELEDGTAFGHFALLTVTVDGREGKAAIIAAPARIPVPEAVAEHQRWGWMTQMYSVRSRESWGIGDYGDLKRLLADAAEKSKADFMLINPIHAGAPIPPLEPSPYLPESRRFLNVTYIRPQDIPEYATLPADVRAQVDALHDSVAARNARIRAFQDHRRPGPRFLRHMVPVLRGMGRAVGREPLVLREDHRRPGRAPARRGAPRPVRVQPLAAVDRCRAGERRAAGGAGPRHDAGADAGHGRGRARARRGCLGQSGTLRLRWRHGRLPAGLLHSMYEHAGAVRIDHVLGLFRLWWIPQGLGARNGAYVTYNHEAMLGVLAIEATRAGGMVVGEDLGTVPDYVRRILADHGVLGTDVEWFNRVDDSPNAGDPYRAPKDYRKQALASVTTHDLPPTAGYLNFAHVKLREELHLLSEPVEAFAASAMAERTAMMNRLVENGYISQTVADDVEGHVQEIVEAMHAMLTDTPSLLLQAALVDGVGECRSQNQPGTSREYSNWRVPLADGEGHVVHTDEVFDLPRVQSLSAVMRREKR